MNNMGTKQVRYMILKPILFIVPIVIYISLFLLYEPYNYWGLRKDQGDRGSPITILRQIYNSNCENIIIGNSRLAAFNPSLLCENGWLDEEWINLSIEGASIHEECQIFWEAVSKQKINKVLFLIGCYSFNRLGNRRFDDSSVRVISSSWGKEYLFNSNSHREVFKRMLQSFSATVCSIFKDNSYNNNYSKKEWKKIYANYVDRIWKPEQEFYSPRTENVVDIVEIINYCKKEGIELILFTMPMQKAVYDYLKSEKLLLNMQFYKSYLSQFARIYDMEYESSAWSDTYGYFVDGVHPKGQNSVNGENPMMEDIYKTMFDKNGSEMLVINNTLCVDTIFADNDVLLPGDGELHVYSQEFQMIPNSIYIVHINGYIPKTAEYMYVDFYDSSERVQSAVVAGMPIQVGETDDYLLILDTRNKSCLDMLFRIVFQAHEDLCVNEINLWRYTSNVCQNRCQ